MITENQQGNGKEMFKHPNVSGGNDKHRSYLKSIVAGFRELGFRHVKQTATRLNSILQHSSAGMLTSGSDNGHINVWASL